MRSRSTQNNTVVSEAQIFCMYYAVHDTYDNVYMIVCLLHFILSDADLPHPPASNTETALI